MKKWLLAAGAFLVVVGFAILGRPDRQKKSAEESRDSLIVDGSRRAKDKAVKAGAKADRLQAEADEAAKIGRAAVDKVGTNNETMRDLLDSWRKPDGV